MLMQCGGGAVWGGWGQGGGSLGEATAAAAVDKEEAGALELLRGDGQMGQGGRGRGAAAAEEDEAVALTMMQSDP